MSLELSNLIYINAKNYSKASKILNNSFKVDKNLIMPSFVNAALSLELYFKALYLITKEKEFKINNRHSHNFYKLFKQLDQDIQRKLTESFKEIIDKKDLSNENRLEEKLCIKFPKDLESNLKHWSQVFVNIRYIYEVENKNINMLFFPEIENIIDNLIIKLKPEFAHS